MFIYIFLLLIFFFIFAVFYNIFKSKKIKYNPNLQKEYYDVAYNILQNNEVVNSERCKHKVLIILSIVFFGLFILFLILSINTSVAIFKVFCFMSIIGAIIILFCSSNESLFRIVIPEIFKSYNSNLSYNHYKGVSRNEYIAADFENFDRFSSEDLIVGNIGSNNNQLLMSEVHTEDRHTDKDGHTSYSTIFRGLYAVSKISKNFNGYLNIVNNKIKIFNRDSYITIDNESFEKIYDVFTNDKIKSMRLLTPDVTSRMIDLYNETGIYCEIKIFDNLLFIRLYTNNLFNLNFSNPSKEAKIIGTSIAILDNALKVIENIVDELERLAE